LNIFIWCQKWDAFVTDLKVKAKTCDFGALRDSLIKDRIVGCVRSDRLRTRLLREPDLILQKAEDVCRADEASEAHFQLLNDAGGSAVHAVDRQFKKDCAYCGKKHLPRKCPAYGQSCSKCGKKSHFASVCRSSDGVAQLIVSEDGYDDLFVNTVSSPDPAKEWTTVLDVQGHRITFTMDTGAQVNILPKSLFSRLKKAVLLRSLARLSTYSGQRLPVVGKSRLTCKCFDKQHTVEFQIVDMRTKPILGLSTCQLLNLVQRVESVDDDESLAEFADVFQGLDDMKDEYHTKVDPSVPSVVNATRKIPAALRDDVLNDLQRMESLGVIEKVNFPTDWVNSLVVVSKRDNGGLRLCLDPRDLN
jgi:hypothetical protein